MSARADRCILHVVPANGGGVDRHVRDLCSLRPMDAILHVSDQQVVLESLRDRRFYPIERRAHAFADIAAKAGRPALLHAHSTLPAARDAVEGLCATWRCGYVLTLHDIEFCHADAAEELLARSAFVAGAAARIAPSDYIRDLLQQSGGNGEPSAIVIANGVNCPSAPRSATVAAQHAGKFAIAVVGALGEHKGLTFLQSVVRALPQGVNVVLIGYADGQLTPGELVEDRLWVHGVFDNAELQFLLDGYGCKLVFFPNRQPESFSYTLSDVWCTRRPVLVPAVGALAERVGRSGGGWTYPAAAGAEAVAAQLLQCLKDVAAGSTTRAIEPPFGVAEMVAQVEAIYASVTATIADAIPDWEALAPIASAQLDGSFFRAELRRLAGDLEFANVQIGKLQTALHELEQEYEGRGKWIAKLEGDLGAIDSQLAGISAERESLLASLHASQRAHERDVEKLTADVGETLAVAHHYERALAQIPGFVRRWMLRRAEKHPNNG